MLTTFRFFGSSRSSVCNALQSGSAALVVVGCLLVVGCKRAPPTPEEKPEPAAVRPLDTKLIDSVRKMAAACTVKLETAAVQCADGSLARLVAEFSSAPEKRIAALPTIHLLVADKDEKVRVVAASLAYDAMRGGFGEAAKVGVIEPELARELVDDSAQATAVLGRVLAPVAVHAAILAGEKAYLFEHFDQDASLAAAGYRMLMVHGRLDVFERVQQLARDERSAVRLSAFEAPRHMPRWSEKDRASICPWAAGFLSDERPLVSSRVASLMSRCSGEYVDKLLAFVELRSSAGQADRAFGAVLREVCAPGMRKQSGVSDPQLDKTRRLMNGLVENKKLDASTRAAALSSVAYCWPDEESSKLAAKHLKDADPVLARSASDVRSRLVQRLSAERPEKATAGPGATGNSHK